MRLSTNQLNNVMLSSMQSANSEANKQLVKLSSGKNMTTPSENPIGSVKLILLEREQAAVDQFKDNISNLETQYGHTETQLIAASNTMIRTKELMLGGMNVSNSTQEGRNATATELETILNQFVDIANNKNPDGSYVFSGTLSDIQPVVKDPASGKYHNNGNGERRMVAVAESMHLPANHTAEQIFFSGGDDIFNLLQQTITDLRNPTISDGDMVKNLATSMQGVEGAFGKVTQAITEVGGLSNSVAKVNDGHEDVTLLNKNLMSEISDLDYSEAVLQLNTQMAALQAVQLSYGKIQNLSLFKYIQ